MKKQSGTFVRVFAAGMMCLGSTPAVALSMAVVGCAGMSSGSQDSEVKPTVKVGTRLPDVPLTKSNGSVVRLTDTTGRIKLISIVPTLKTLVSESQTRHVSEALPALEGAVERLTVSTNAVEDQERFAKEAGIRNMTFFSDAPQFAFGAATGLRLPKEQGLHRAVIVADRENVVRYFELVPLSQLPNYDQLHHAVRKLAGKP